MANIDRRNERPNHVRAVPSKFDRTPEVRSEKQEAESLVSDITRDEVKARLEASEARVATAVEGMRADQAEFRADLKTGIADFRVEMEKMRGEFHQGLMAQTKWIVVIVFSAIAAAGTLWSFIKPSTPPAATVSQPAPYVIYAAAPPAPSAASPVAPTPASASTTHNR